MPPLRRVTSCSPSARARTVTAHSLNAIGIGPLERVDRRSVYCPVSSWGETYDLTRRHILCTKSRKLIISLQITALVLIGPIPEERFHTGFRCELRRACRRGP